MRAIPYETLDVFTRQAFAGNQLGLVPDARRLSSAQMQAIAQELNYAETVFLFGEGGGAGPRPSFRARIFTPRMEVPFAGHPVIGAAGWLFEGPAAGREALDLGLPIGPLRVEREPGGLTFLTAPPVEIKLELSDRALLSQLYGVGHEEFDFSRLPALVASAGLRYLLAPLRSRAALEHCACNSALLAQMDARFGFNQLTAYCFEPYVQGSLAAVRMFAPLHGVPEDPATGSSAAVMTACLARYGVLAPGEEWQSLDQGFGIARPSRLFVRAVELGGGIRAQVGGHSVRSARGELYLPDFEAGRPGAGL